VCGTSELITRAINGSKRDFSISFDAESFEGTQFTLDWCGKEGGGNWYTCPQLGNSSGWLCPALYKYFEEAPERIFIRFDS
jgi:hypothetical protein